MSFTAASLHPHMLRLPDPRRYWVAFSGGLDSHSLLHALCELRSSLPCPVHAVHIHHGLQSAADSWVQHCQMICAELGVELTVRHVVAQARPGESPEAAARDARYAALRDVMQSNEMILSAHHQDDQAETILLQLLRGSGVSGLAGMPVSIRFGSGWLCRPLLGFTREMLAAYATQQQLNWINDPSNSNIDFDRNYLRHEVMPVVQRRWPMSAATLARAAMHQAEAAALLNELATLDWQQVQGNLPQCIAVTKLQGLLPSRQRNVLRYWLKEICRLPLPDTRHMARIQDEMMTAKHDANPEVCWPGVEVRRYDDQLYAMTPLTEVVEGWSSHWDMNQPLALPGMSLALQCRPVRGAGLRSDAIQAGVTVRFRQGGETLQLPHRAQHHALKKLLQEWGVPPWLRDRIPLIYVQDKLAQVLGYCISGQYAAKNAETGLEISVVPYSTVAT